MPQEVHEVHRCAHQEEVFGTNQDSESYPPGQIPPFMEKRKGDEEDPKEEAVILKVDVVDDKEGESEAAAEGRETAGEAVDVEEESEVGDGDGEALEEEGGVVLADNKVDDGGLKEGGGEGEEKLKVGEERGVDDGGLEEGGGEGESLCLA